MAPTELYALNIPAVRLEPTINFSKMKSLTEHLWFEVPDRRGFINITPTIEELVHRSGVMEGLCLVNTSDLELRRYEIKHCLSMASMGWDKRPWQSNAYDEVKDDLEKKGSHRARNYTPWRDGLSLATFGDIPIRA